MSNYEYDRYKSLQGTALLKYGHEARKFCTSIDTVTQCVYCTHTMIIMRIIQSYIQKPSDMAGMAFLAKKNCRKIWPKYGLKSPKMA